MTRFILRKPLLFFVVLFVFNLSSIFADENLLQPTSVSLSYKEVRPGTETQCGGGGILGALDCVAIRIEGAGEDGKINSNAALSITLNPVLRAEGNYREIKVYVRADMGSPSISTTFENQAQVEAEVKSDTRMLKERLKRWSATLGAGQLDELKTTGETSVVVRRPFEGLKLLGLETSPVALTLRMPPLTMGMEFLVKNGSGFEPTSQIAYGEVFVVEVTFTQPQPEPTFFVDLDWPGASMKYEARVERADNTGKIYRSSELRARYLNGPGVELAIDPGGP